jgi:hypothetical protein
MNNKRLWFLLIILINNASIVLIECADGKGMTWRIILHDDSLNINMACCIGCDAYSGETSCSTKLPILCYSSNTKFHRPPYDTKDCYGTSCVMTSEYYDGWSGGNFFLTQPYLGTSLISASNMDKICSDQFGK